MTSQGIDILERVFRTWIPVQHLAIHSNEDKTLYIVKTPNKILEALEQFLYGQQFTDEELEKVKPLLHLRNDYWLPVLIFCSGSKSKREILEHIGLTNQTKNLHFRTTILPLLEYGLMLPTVKDRPSSRYQKYYTSPKGQKMIQLLEQIENTN